MDSSYYTFSPPNKTNNKHVLTIVIHYFTHILLSIVFHLPAGKFYDNQYLSMIYLFYITLIHYYDSNS